MALDELKAMVISLTMADLSAFSDWLIEEQQHRADAWDDQIERDVVAGKLDAVYDDLAHRYRAGESASLSITTEKPA